MSGFSNWMTVLGSVVCVVLLLTAGCATEPTGDSTTEASTSTNSPTEELEETTTTVERTETTLANRTTTEQPEQTTTRGVFGSIEHELQVKNYLNESKNVSVEIESANGTVVFDKNLQMGGNSSKEFDFEFPHTGPYEVVVNTPFANETRTWNVTRRNPTVAMSVVLIDDNELHVGLEAI